MEKFFALIRKHLIIKNKEILIVFAIIILYKTTYSIFSFSIMRFMVEAIGRQYFLIGMTFAVSNAIAIFIDIPLGITQKYIQPRYFILLAILMLMMSDLIFMMSAEAFWLVFLAVLFYQLSVEVFFITIVTFILRMSGKNDSSQNVAQSDIADNIGDMTGIGLAGFLFTIDRSVDAHNFIVILFLFCVIFALLFFVYEFADNRHQTKMEKYILNMKLNRKIIEASSHFAEQLVTHEAGEVVADVPEEKAEQKPIVFSEIASQVRVAMKDLAGTFVSLIKDPFSEPLLVWTMLIIIVTTFWSEAINFFEPLFTKSLFASEESIITTNFSRYLFESAMLMMGLLLPTFFFEYPLSKLADKWGKEKIIVACTIFAGLSLAFLAALSQTVTFFFVFLILGIAYVGIYPAMASLINDEYGKVAAKRNKSTPERAAASSTDEDDGGSESMSAALLSILMNLGQITAGIVAGGLLTVLSFKFIFFLIGFVLTIIGVMSWLWIREIKPEPQKIPVVAEPSKES